MEYATVGRVMELGEVVGSVQQGSQTEALWVGGHEQIHFWSVCKVFAQDLGLGGMSTQQIERTSCAAMPFLRQILRPWSTRTTIPETCDDIFFTFNALSRSARGKQHLIILNPAETWGFLTFPNNNNQNINTTAGLQYKNPELSNSQFRKSTVILHGQIRRCQSSPLQWHKSRCIASRWHKRNGKRGPTPKRHVHVLDAYGKNYHIGLRHLRSSQDGPITHTVDSAAGADKEH